MDKQQKHRNKEQKEFELYIFSLTHFNQLSQHRHKYIVEHSSTS
jgi:hypothetical protein